MAFEIPRLENLTSQPDLQKQLLGLLKGKGSLTLLWVGPEGAGKKTHALALARSLFCSEGQGCSGCPACKQVAAKTHPDLFWVDREHVWAKDEKERKKTETTVEVVRNLSERLNRAPLSAPWKVAVIPDAEEMNGPAQDSFLKTLEEPPPATLIIMIARTTGAFLPTVLSRCRILRFPALPEGTLQGILTGSYGWEMGEALGAARESGGNLALALRSSDPEWTSFRKKVWADLDRGLSGSDLDWLSVSQEYEKWEPEILGDQERTASQRKAEVGYLVFQVYLGLWMARRSGEETTPQGLASLSPDLAVEGIRIHQDLLATNMGLKMVLDRFFLHLREAKTKGAFPTKTLVETAMGL